MIKCKITVLKVMLNKEIADEYCEPASIPCPVFKEGQEFIYEAYGEGNKPEGFCENAWNDIYKYVMALSTKGNYTGWMKQDGTNIVCCTDGTRPVVFKLQRIEEG